MKGKRRTALFLCGTLLCGTLGPAVSVSASAQDGVLDVPYVSLGADITPEERTVVLELLGLTEESLANDQVVYVTNEEEHQYLDSYIAYDVIGTEAKSCSMIVGKEDGYGIQVTTKNIDYCTIEMYQNALATAGVENADITVAGPIKVSGTAGLIGVLEAYSVLTGEPLQAESVDAAVNELVTTGEIADVLGDSEKAAELIAAVKAAIVAEGLDDPDKEEETIREYADEMGVALTDEEVQQIVDVMQKIVDLDLDSSTLSSQLSGIYSKLDEMGISISKEDVNNFMSTLGNWFASLFGSIGDWFKQLFGN